MIGNSNDETNFPHKLLLTNRLVTNICIIFANNLSPDIKLSKTQLSKMIQSGGFLGRVSGLSGNMLAGRFVRAGCGSKGKGIIRTVYGSNGSPFSF